MRAIVEGEWVEPMSADVFPESSLVDITYGGRTIRARVKDVRRMPNGGYDVTFEEVLDSTPT